ncbi:hypothetical protein COLO4_00788, partial [Corchorus olitorius]
MPVALRRARLLRAAPEEVHERLGYDVSRHCAGWRYAALPLCAHAARAGIAQRAQPAAARHLAKQRRLSALSRHALDARAVPVVRVARGRRRRLPVSGLSADGRCDAHRPGVWQIGRSRHAADGGAARPDGRDERVRAHARHPHRRSPHRVSHGCQLAPAHAAIERNPGKEKGPVNAGPFFLANTAETQEPVLNTQVTSCFASSSL